MKSVPWMLAASSLLMAACVGCEPPGPTYSEALQNYTAEMQELQRLRTERGKIEQAGNTVEVDLAALLTKPLDLSSGQDLDLLKSGTLDKLVDRAAQEMALTKWQQARAKNGERLKDAAAETEAINAERKRLGLPVVEGIAPEAAAYEAEQAKAKDRDKALAEIDKQIAVQQERVDRARAVKDKIEARRR